MSKPVKIRDGSADDVQVITTEDVARVVEGVGYATHAPEGRGVLSTIAPDGLPTIMPEAAAQRAVEYVQSRGFGPNSTAIIAHIASRAVDTADLNVVIMEQLAERLLTASTAEEMLAPFEPEKGEAYVNTPFTLLSAEYMESDHVDGFPWFASIRIRLSGESHERVVTVGGEKLVPMIGALDMRGALPCAVMITGRQTKKGYTVYGLELAPPI